MKKKSCRRTDEERSIHEQATRVRKMTDAQLVEYLNAIRAEGRAAGRAEASGAPAPTVENGSVEKLLEELAAGECYGVKGATVYKIAQFAQERGYIR